MPTPTASTFTSPKRRLAWTATALALSLLLAPRFAAADDKAPAKTGSTSGGGSVMDGFRSLGQQISDPKTPDRLKGHEQEFEKNVQGTRDQQRKAHPGELRASDATGMANDPKMGGPGAKGGKSAPKAAPKPKAGAAKTTDTGADAAKAPPKAPPPAAGSPAR